MFLQLRAACHPLFLGLQERTPENITMGFLYLDHFFFAITLLRSIPMALAKPTDAVAKKRIISSRC